MPKQVVMDKTIASYFHSCNCMHKQVNAAQTVNIAEICENSFAQELFHYLYTLHVQYAIDLLLTSPQHVFLNLMLAVILSLVWL